MVTNGAAAVVYGGGQREEAPHLVARSRVTFKLRKHRARLWRGHFPPQLVLLSCACHSQKFCSPWAEGRTFLVLTSRMSRRTRSQTGKLPPPRLSADNGSNAESSQVSTVAIGATPTEPRQNDDSLEDDDGEHSFVLEGL